MKTETHQDKIAELCVWMMTQTLIEEGANRHVAQISFLQNYKSNKTGFQQVVNDFEFELRRVGWCDAEIQKETFNICTAAEARYA